MRAAGLVPQRHLEDWGISGLNSSERMVDGEPVTTSIRLSRFYTVLRDPDDLDDPVDLRPLDADLRRMQAEETPDDLPDWMAWMRDRGRFPQLWEAVQTHVIGAGAADGEPGEVAPLLASHVDYVLHNAFREEHGLGDPTDHPWVRLAHRDDARPADVVVDGAVVPGGMVIDADAFVVGVGAPLADGRVVTAVVPRAHLDLITLELVADGPDEPAAPLAPRAGRRGAGS
ncbi:hypothetical protein DZG00_10685 [Clavibacter lycopersici]|uniref:Uncharacterized protein n=1 Tax=Clavibacter lycopersici TaxID=2301718 RepID=A0A399T3K6_9MICO|nr:hypothetical protein [Clavibacter lycopersici]RIJ50970.1 hypothetical protein DZG00_10685 [Clavibacter lycopersici]RIJ61383.1 hypothetical protein DZG02_07300 [Clavibacter lycopersici]